MRLLRQSTAFTFRAGPFVDSADGVTAETTLTIAQADIQISKDGGAFAQTSASPTTTHDADGWYQCPLTSTDTGTLGPLTVQIVMAGALPVWEHFMVVPANVYDSIVDGSDLLDINVSQFGGSNGTFSGGRPEVNATHWGGTAVASAVVRSTLQQILGTAISEGAAGRIAGAFQTLLDVATPALTVASVNQTGDSFARIGATGSGLTSLASASSLSTLAADVTSILAAVDTEIAAIKAKTDNLPSDPADESLLEAAITAAQTAILAKVLKYFQLSVRKDSAIATDNATELTEINANGGSGAGSYANTSESQEAIGDKVALDSTVAKASALATAQTSLDTIAGYLDTEIASIISSLSTIAGYLDTEIAAILADTNELQTDWANGGRLDLLIDGITTLVTAVKAVTDVLPDSGALTSLAQDSTVAKEATLTTTGRSDPSALGAALGSSLSPLSKLDWILARVMRENTFNKTTGEEIIKNAAGTDIAKATAADDGTTTTRGAFGAP